MATSYLSPGVYIEEVDRGTKPIEMVGTSTVGFLGECKVGPVNEPVLCTNWSQYTKQFGDFANSEYLAHAVYGFFNNGGGRCFVLNVGDTHLVVYALKKLSGLGLIEGSRKGKERFYATTAEGREVCATYRRVRKDCLMASFQALGLENADVGELTERLRVLSGLYDQAARGAASL